MAGSVKILAGIKHLKQFASGGLHSMESDLLTGLHTCTGAELTQDLANTLPSANTELGAFTRIGLMTGAVEMARRTAGLSSI